jgi:peroxiredoxin
LALDEPGGRGTMLEAGLVAPEFSLMDADGERHTLAEARRRGPVLVTFFKISCPTSQYFLYYLDRLTQQIQSTAVTVWAISQDSPEHTAMFNEEFDLSLPQLFDSEDDGFPASDAYGVVSVPTTFLVHRDGRIAFASAGWNRMDFEEMARLVGKAVGLPPLSVFTPEEKVDEDRPGCTSKN